MNPVWFTKFTSPGSMSWGDVVTLDGKNLYYFEEGPDFPLGSLDGQIIPMAKPLTSGQLWDQHRIKVGGRILPAGTARLLGSDAFWGDAPALTIPMFRQHNGFETWGGSQHNYQNTSQVTGYVCKVKDDAGKFWEAPPVNLKDKDWNAVKVKIGNFDYGVWVWCDSTAGFGPNW